MPSTATPSLSPKCDIFMQVYPDAPVYAKAVMVLSISSFNSGEAASLPASITSIFTVTQTAQIEVIPERAPPF